jgi:hypothetical protein
MRVHEAGLQAPTILVELDSYDIAPSAHESDAYQMAPPALGSGAEPDFRIVEEVFRWKQNRWGVAPGAVATVSVADPSVRQPGKRDRRRRG